MPTIIAALYLCILAFDFRPHLKGAKRREKAVYLAVLTLGCVLAVFHVVGVNLPSPAPAIENAVRAVFGVE